MYLCILNNYCVICPFLLIVILSLSFLLSLLHFLPYSIYNYLYMSLNAHQVQLCPSIKAITVADGLFISFSVSIYIYLSQHAYGYYIFLLCPTQIYCCLTDCVQQLIGARVINFQHVTLYDCCTCAHCILLIKMVQVALLGGMFTVIPVAIHWYCMCKCVYWQQMLLGGFIFFLT